MNPLSKYSPQLLKHHVFEVGARNRNSPGHPVYSVTNYNGFVPSEEYFKKQVFSKDTANYKIVPRGAFAYNPSRINVGSIDYLRHETPVLVSPLYIVFNTSDELHPAYLKRFLLSEAGMSQIDHYTQGAVRDSLKFSGLQKIEIPLPPLEEQKRIAAVLDKADALRRQRQESLELTEKLLQSVFIEMFGDPIQNPKGWPMLELGKFGIVQTGNTPPRSNKDYYSSEGLEWIKTDNIVEDRVIVTPAAERLSASGIRVARIAPAESLLVACIAGSEKSIGRAALTDRKVAFNQQINAITPHADVSPLFLYFLMKVARRQVQMAAAKGMKKMINKSTFESLLFIAPNEDQQREFEKVAQKLIRQSQDCHEQLPVLDSFFSSLQQRAFRGELDLSRVVLDAEAPELEPKLDDILIPEEPPKSLGPVHGFASFKVGSRRLVPTQPVEAKLKVLDAQLERGELIEWSPDYFRFRLLGRQAESFRAGDILQKAATLFTEETLPKRDDLVSQMLDMMEAVGEVKVPAPVLKQRFDKKRQEIRLELVP